MKYRFGIILLALVFLSSFSGEQSLRNCMKNPGFNIEKDLLLANYDCKTDVDDLHSVAAFYTLLSNPAYSDISYHAVAGSYGTQEGLYVPPNELFQRAFGENWTDAHKDFNAAVEKVKFLVIEKLEDTGDIWIAEAGQSDFSAALIREVSKDFPEINLNQRIHVVQHADWNEKVTTAADLQYVKENTDYHRIQDGNSIGNGTPGFRSPDFTNWSDMLADSGLLEVWQLAFDLGMKYNGKEGRYNNEAVAAGGLDFSDMVEVVWILGIENVSDSEDFFRNLAR